MAQDEAARERAHILQTQASSTGPSHGMDETGTVSPKPSESSLRRTYSAPTKTSSTHGLSRPAPKFGPMEVQEPGEPEKPTLDDTEPMQIIVAPNPLTLVVTRNTTTEEAKMLIQEKEGTPVARQRLIYAGRQLDALRTLKDYNVQPGSTLRMVLRLHGGAEGLNFVRFNSQ